MTSGEVAPENWTILLGVVRDGTNHNDHKLLGDALVELRTSPNDDQNGLSKGYDYPESRQLAQAESPILHLRKRGILSPPNAESG